MIKVINSFNTFKNTPDAKSYAPQKEKSFLDKFETGIVNSADLNDTIKVPRTIFKGYMAFMVSSTLLAISTIFNKNKAFTTTLNVASALTALYGTFSFTRPYLIKTKKD